MYVLIDNYPFSGHPIEFCKVKWQLNYKKTESTPIYSPSDSEEEKFIDMSNYFFLNIFTSF